MLGDAMKQGRGRPRLDYDELGRDYVDEILTGGILGVFNRLSEKWDVGIETAKARIKRGRQYGQIPTYIRVMHGGAESMMAKMAEEGHRPIGYVQAGWAPVGRIYLEVARSLNPESSESVNE